VEVSLLGAALAVQIQDLVWIGDEADGAARPATRGDLGARADEIAGGLGMNPYYRCFEAVDGFLAVACLNLAQRRAFLDLFGLEDGTIEAPDVVPADTEVLTAKQAVTTEVERAIASEPVEAWLARLGAAGVPAGPVLVRESVHADAQVRANGLVQEVEQPGLGRVALLGGVFRFDESNPPPTRPAPALGADTDAVLREVGL
jgi:crotonobetainyl-CoA:carnitine CoA-transferase CaiB-like acyl-CoA transferase